MMRTKNLVAMLMLLLIVGIAAAKDKAKDYPLTGTVVSFHNQQGVRGVVSDGDGAVNSYERRVYVIKTDTGNLEVTGWENGFKARKRPPLSLGQQLLFRTDGKYIYTVLDDAKEHRFYIMSAS
ncbi:MAG: hypothetical protein WCF22_04780 [Candidatus Sulfotelmatobacter sp.]